MKRKFSKILGVGLTVALLASLLVVVAPVSALTQPSVTPTSTTISATTSYSILFTLGASVAEGGKIVVAFPTGTDLTNVAAADITLAATSGIGSEAFNATAAATIVKSPSATTGPTVTITVPDVNAANKIGAGAIVQVVIADVTNPATAGTTYTLTVGTLASNNAVIEAAVTSAAYSITVPTIEPLPGIVSVYNTAGVLVFQNTGAAVIANAIAATAIGYTIRIGPGTYTETTLNTLDGATGVTFVATGTAAETIIKTTLTIDVATITLDGLTITGGIVATTGATNAVIKNSILKPSTAASVLLAIDATTLTSTNTSFAVTGTTVTSGITVASGATVTVTDGIFTVDTGGTDIVSTGTTTVTNGTFTGSVGTGIEVVAAGTVTVTGATFDTLGTALKVTGAGGTLTARNNTIKNSTGDAISIDGSATAKVTITGNDITGGITALKYAVVVTATADAEKVFVVFNNITGNTLNVKNLDTTNILNATHNWWGLATGPATTSISTASLVSTAGYLTAAATTGTGAVATAAATLTGKTTAGVDVVATGGPPAIIAASKYAANPVAVEPLYTALTGGYFDVYVGTPGATTAIDIKLYGAVTATTEAYAWSTLQGKWVKVSIQGMNTFGGFAYITVTDTSTPAIADLAGLPFVLVSGPVAAPATIALTAPAAGATTPITNLPFTWASVAGATSYSLVISASANLSSPITATATGTAYTYAGTLGNGTPYYWQVTALKDTTVSGKSDIATFVTVAAPVVVVVPPVVVAPAAPISIVSPSLGAVGVSLNPILTWTPYEKAIGYEVALGTDPNFKILDYGHNVPATNTFYASEPLAYATTYYWRVRGVTGAAAKVGATAPGGAWATSAFTTMAEPVAAAKVEPTIIIQKEPAPPAEVIKVPVTTVVSQPIPSYLLWIIIVIGAVLIIALIVLIARTRRVA